LLAGRLYRSLANALKSKCSRRSRDLTTPQDLSREYPVDPARTWHNMTGVIRTHQAMAEIEKPIVAKVNGDAIGFGQSLVFGSDLIVAVEDALIADHHLGMGEIGDEIGGHLFGTVPGDGGMARRTGAWSTT